MKEALDECVCTLSLHERGLLFHLAQSRSRVLVALPSCLCVNAYSLSLTLQPAIFLNRFQSVPLSDASRSANFACLSWQASKHQTKEPLATCRNFAITIVCYFFNFQDGLRPAEAQFINLNDPRRTTGGFRRHICVLTATPEGFLLGESAENDRLRRRL